MCLSVTGREQGGNIFFYLLGVAEYLSGSSGHAVQRARNHCAGKRSDTDGACLFVHIHSLQERHHEHPTPGASSASVCHHQPVLVLSGLTILAATVPAFQMGINWC